MTRSTLLSNAFVAVFVAVSFVSAPAFAGDNNHSGHDTPATHKKHHENGTHESHVKDGTYARHHKKLFISAAWTRATVKTAKVGGGYITIKNYGDEPDRLLSGVAGFAERVQIHEMKLVDDIMRMRLLPDGVEIPAGGEVVLKPGGEHVMFMGLKRPLVEGEEIRASLVFEKAGEVPVVFKVNGLAAKTAGNTAHGQSN